ncbi:MAG: 2-dehydro-3-deoxy-D-gluconate 5-dehydrogenase KduD [Erysipelotrichaceae bacterium]|nr:2-dehydro-3-deoxy-D-gluconate 5-dehydrogenase KduD [Erysipelotrichaceae bacterium]
MSLVQKLFSLEGKTAIVTGANTGLGQGISVALAAAGAHVFGVARRSCAETLEKVNAVGGTFTEVIADLSDMSAIDKIIAEVSSKTERIDILVNNAGIIKREDAINVTVEDWDQVINLNQKMVFFLSQAVAKRWIEDQKGGKIINICSMLSYQGGIRVPSYTTSKSGIIGLTRALANEWAKYNINVNGIAPGYMATNNTTQLRNDASRSEDILSRIPAARWGTPEDMYGAAIFLASDASAYMNGFTVAVDGGWLAR